MASHYKLQIYKDETGIKKGEIQERKLIETETYSVDKFILICQVIATTKKEDWRSI